MSQYTKHCTYLYYVKRKCYLFLFIDWIRVDERVFSLHRKPIDAWSRIKAKQNQMIGKFSDVKKVARRRCVTNNVDFRHGFKFQEYFVDICRNPCLTMYCSAFHMTLFSVSLATWLCLVFMRHAFACTISYVLCHFSFRRFLFGFQECNWKITFVSRYLLCFAQSKFLTLVFRSRMKTFWWNFLIYFWLAILNSNRSSGWMNNGYQFDDIWIVGCQLKHFPIIACDAGGDCFMKHSVFE